jgi:hypothetical protein
MARFIYLFLGFLLAGITNLHAQDKGKNLLKNDLDSLITGGQDSPEALAQIPIYYPQNVDSKILLLKPEGFIDNMPIVGKNDSFSKKRVPQLGKNPLKNIPGDIYKKQESDSTKQK